MDCSFLNFQIFKEGFSSLFCKYAPKKTKLFRGNQKPHVNKVLHSVIMKRSRLKTKANKTCKAVDVFNYKKQRNLVLKINNECKREYFDKLKVKTAVKPFWKTCKPSSQTNIHMVAPK